MNKQKEVLNFDYEKFFNEQQIKAFKEKCRASAVEDLKEDLNLFDFSFNEDNFNLNHIVVKIVDGQHEYNEFIF